MRTRTPTLVADHLRGLGFGLLQEEQTSSELRGTLVGLHATEAERWPGFWVLFGFDVFL